MLCWQMRTQKLCYRTGYSFGVSMLVVLLLTILGCHRLESDWEKAQAQDTTQAYEEFLRRHSEGPFAVKAQERIAELDWDSVSQTHTSQAYLEFLARHPEGPLSAKARERIIELDWNAASQENTITAFESFAKKWPPDNPLVRRAYIQRDALALARAEVTVLTGEKYKKLPTKLELLTSYITSNPKVANIKLAKQAREDVLIEQLKILGPGSHFILPDISIHPGKGYRYSIRSVSIETKVRFSCEFDFADSSWAGKSRTTARGIADTTILFTDYPDDKIPIRNPTAGMQTCVGMGEISEYGFDPSVHQTDGTVWRFFNRVVLFRRQVIVGNLTDPLTFYLMEGVGPVYLSGKGSVTKDDVMLFSIE